ncbi:UNVERIFIED_ORG: hypothetical protein B5F06_12945 [Lacrimispora saccharolytica]
MPSRLASRWAARQMHAHASMACAFLAIVPYPPDMYLSEGCALAAIVFWLPSGASGSAQV